MQVDGINFYSGYKKKLGPQHFCKKKKICCATNHIIYYEQLQQLWWHYKKIFFLPNLAPRADQMTHWQRAREEEKKFFFVAPQTFFLSYLGATTLKIHAFSLFHRSFVVFIGLIYQKLKKKVYINVHIKPLIHICMPDASHKSTHSHTHKKRE